MVSGNKTSLLTCSSLSFGYLWSFFLISSFEHHLSSSMHRFILLKEIQVFWGSDFSALSWYSYCQFSSKGECWSDVKNDIICSWLSNFVCTEFSTLWFELSCQSTTKFIYLFIYLLNLLSMLNHPPSKLQNMEHTFVFFFLRNCQFGRFQCSSPSVVFLQFWSFSWLTYYISYNYEQLGWFLVHLIVLEKNLTC